MLKFLFDRNSKFIVVLEVAAIGAALYIIFNDLMPTRGDVLLFTTLWSSYIFLRACTFISWHHKSARTSGIGLHFRKAMVPTSYILAISNWSYMLFQATWVFCTTIILLAAIMHVNLILIYINLRHRSLKPANFLSASALTN